MFHGLNRFAAALAGRLPLSALMPGAVPMAAVPEVVVGRSKPAAAPSPLEETIGSEALERYESALARLSPSDRELIVARVESK